MSGLILAYAELRDFKPVTTKAIASLGACLSLCLRQKAVI